MKNSKLFKRSLLLLAVVALAVVLTIGIVAGAATISEGNADYGEVYAGVNVSVKGQVALRFYFETLGTAEEFVAEITDPAGNTTSKTYPVETVKQVTVGSGEQARQLYRVSVSLAPSQMTYSVKLYANGASGAGKAYVYSVKEYAQDVIADPDLSEDHDAMRALLNWGAMARVFFDKTTEDLANEGIFARGTNPANAVKDIPNTSITPVSSTNETVFPTENKAVSLNVYLTNTDVAMGFIFPYNGGGTLTADIYKNGALVKEDDAVVLEKEGYWRANVRDLTATCYDDVYKVVVSDGTNSMTAEYSILAYVDYVIAADSQAADGSLIGEEQKNVCRAMYQLYKNVAEGAINADCTHSVDTYWIDNGDGTHSYKCVECFKQYANVKVPADASTYYTAFDIDQPANTANPYHPKSIYKVTTTADYSGSVAFTRIEGAEETPVASQLLWQRAAEDSVYNQSTGNQQRYSVDVGNARYFVIKAKTNTPDLRVLLSISTTGKNGDTDIATEGTLSGDGKKVNINNEILEVGDTYVKTAGYVSIRLPLNAVKADEWGTYVIDLAEVVPEYYVKEGDSYKVDTFYLHFSSFGVGQTMDVAYMAFVEDGWNTLPALVDTAEAIELTSIDGGYTVKDQSGACLHRSGKGSVAIVGGEYHYVCNECGGTLVDYNVPETVEKFCPAPVLTNSTYVSGQTPSFTYMEESGIGFTRFTGLTPNADSWFAINPSIGYGNEETGRYLVMRFRSNAQGVNSASMQILGSTISGNCVGAAIATVRDTSDDAWHTVVIDLATKVTDPASAFKPEEGTADTYVLRYLQIRPFASFQKTVPASAYMDIQYIAVCNELGDVSDIVKEDTYEWSVNGGTNVIKNKNTHVCVAHGYVESRVDNADGTVTFVSACPCGETRYTKNFPASAKVVYDPSSMITQGTSATDGRLTVSTYHQMPNKSVKMESFPFFRFYGASDGVTQMLWQRTTANSGGGTQLYKTNVGNSRFMILKLRTNDNTVSWNLKYGTVGAGNSGASYYIPFNSVQSGEWATYVIDLNEVMAAYHKQTDGAYLVDNFYFTSSGLATDEYIDIAYLAFVEGDWSNIDEIVEDTTVIRIVDRSKGYSIVDPATGICAGAVHNYVSKTTTNNDGSKTSTIACSVCGKVVATQNIPANINYFADLSTMSYFNNDGTGLNKNMIDFESGIAYNHFYATSSTHWNITGNGSNNYNNAGAYTSAKYSTGEYIVIKYRAGSNADSSMTLYLGTGNVNASNVQASKIGTLSAKANEGWKVAVVKITDAIGTATVGGVDKGIGYTVKSEQTLYFMAMPQPDEARQMDIAYFAVVDSLAEVGGLLDEGETYFYHGTSLSNATNEMTKDGECITHAIPTAETVDGNTRSIVCPVCGTTLRSYDLEAVNWFSPLSEMKCMTANLLTTNLYDADNHLFYNRYTSTSGCHFLFTGGSAAGTWTTESYDTGNFVVVKYRAEATSTIVFNVSTADHGEHPDYPSSVRPYYSSVGDLQLRDMAGVGADGWRVAVVAIPDGVRYTKGSNQRIYFQMTSGSGNTTLDIAYCAVIDTLDEVKGLLGEGEGFYYHGTSIKNEPSKGDSNGNCLHTALVCKTVGNNYQIVCNACGFVSYDYNIDKSAATPRTNGSSVLFRMPSEIGKFTNCTILPDNVATAAFDAKLDQLEVGSPMFVRFNPNPNMSDGSLRRGRNMLGGSAATDANYFVIKFRVGENGFGQDEMTFYVGAQVEANELKIKVSEDNQWHVVVVDLKARVGNGNVFDGSFTKDNEVWFQPYGDVGTAALKAKPEAYVDIAYAAACSTLEDVTKLVGGDTYEWSVDATTNETRYIKDIICPDGCTVAVVAEGNNLVSKCSVCGTVSYDYKIDKSAVSSFTNGSDTAGWGEASTTFTRTPMTEEGSPSFIRYQETDGLAWDDQHYYGMYANKGQYLILKVRLGANANGQTDVFAYFPSSESKKANTNAWASADVRFKVSEDNQWHTIVIDLAARSKEFAPNSDGSYSVADFCLRFYGSVVSAWTPDDYFDLAYYAVAESLDDVSKFIGEETYEWSVSAEESIIRDTATHQPVVAE